MVQKNIYIVGFMGVGKSTVGKILSKKLAREFSEMDKIIEEQQGKKIVDIFADEGEGYFRQLEKALLKLISKRNDLVISCGGGLICNDENVYLLKETGIIFVLTASPATIYERTKKGNSRPILNVDDPLARIKELLVSREPYYAKADYIIDTETISPEEISGKIVTILGNG